MWAGADLELGEIYEFEEDTPLPMIPGAVVPMISRFSVERRIACIDGGTAQDCVSIRLVSEPEPAAAKRILAEFMQRLTPNSGLGGFGFEELQVRNEIVLITEPQTLLPHRLSISKQVDGRVSAGGQSSTISQRDGKMYKFTYAR
jgi:hypothetical protein